MSVLALLHDLAAKKIRVWLDGDQLRFKAPKGAMTATLRKRLKSQKEAVIAHLAKNLSVRQADEAIPRADRSGVLPLSYAQQRLWFIDLLDPGNPTYNISFANEMVGTLDPVALESAFADLLARHESLRTRFPNQDGQPIQVIEPLLEPEIRFFDFNGWDEATQKEAVAELVGAFAKQPFCLGEGPLFRLALCKLSPTHHVLTVALHHIVADGWSLDVFLSEWGTLYHQRLQGRQPHLEPLTIQYADFGMWQREFLDKGAMREQTDFWKEKLAQPRSDSQLPTDYARPNKLSHQGALHFFSIDKAIFASLRHYRESEGATPFMTFLAAFMVLLYRLSDQKDLLIGTPVAQRDRAELEQLIGFLVNTVIIRGDLRENPTFEELHRQIHATTLSSFAHADVPFEKLVEVLQPERDPSRNPLMQVMFSMHNSERKAFELPGLTLAPFAYEAAVAHFDLTLGLEIHGDELLGYFEYSTDLFHPAFIERMAQAFEHLLTGIAGDTKRNIAAYDVLDEAEKQQLGAGWKQPQNLNSSDLVGQLRETAAAWPTKPAIQIESSVLTYGQLEKQSNQLAEILEEKGVEPGLRVMLAMQDARSVLALVALAKLAAVVVPVNPAWPDKTLAAGAKVIQPFACLGNGAPPEGLTDQNWVNLAALELGNGVETFAAKHHSASLRHICLDTDAFGQVHPGELTQTQLLEACETWSELGVGQEKAVVILGSPSAFPMLSATLATLLKGGQLVIPTQAKPNREVLASLKVASSNVFICDPFQVQAVLATATKSEVVEKLLIVGDGAAIETLGTLPTVEKVSQWQFVYAQANGDHLSSSSPNPKFADDQAWVLDRNKTYQWQIHDPAGQITPQGVPGQIVLESGTKPTGEKGRILSDGRPQLMGTMARRVRLDGFRLDLEQIEKKLAQHDGIEQTHVDLMKDQQGEQQLVTWFLPRGSAVPEASALKMHLQKEMVEACIPQYWQQVESLPADFEGRVLTEALPPVNLSEQSAEPQNQDPANPHEWLMAMIWSDVLGVKQVQREDHFFKLGGHSLMAVLVLARVKDYFDQSVPMRALFENPTLRGFTAQIVKAKAA